MNGVYQWVAPDGLHMNNKSTNAFVVSVNNASIGNRGAKEAGMALCVFSFWCAIKAFPGLSSKHTRYCRTVPRIKYVINES